MVSRFRRRRSLIEMLEDRRVMAAIGLTTTPYSQNFDTLASTGTTITVPNGEFTGDLAGWFFVENNAANDTSAYRVGTGSANAGDVYSFGAAEATDRALGTLLSGSLNPTIGARFQNDNAAAITELAVSYVGEMWRLGTANRDDRLDFQFSTDATALSNGSWTDVDNLDFSSPDTTGSAGARDGNSADFRTAIAHTITGLNIAPGSTFWIRWTDFNAASADDGLAVDDFVITATAGGDTTPPTVVSIDDSDDDDIVVVNEMLIYTITFSEDIDETTVSAADFDNGAADDPVAITIGTITETTPGVFSVQVTPTTAGNLQLRIPLGAEITDVAGNALVVPVVDIEVITVTATDITPPTVVSITDDDADDIVGVGATVTYTVTFSEDIDETTVSAADFDNAGTSTITIGTITEPSPGVFAVPVTATSEGTLRLRIPTTATILDLAGNQLVVDPAILDAETITVDGTAPTLTSIEDSVSGGPGFVNQPIIFTVTFNEDIDAATVTADDFNNAGDSSVTFGAISETSPGVFSVVVTPTTAGTVQLRIPTTAVISDVAGNNLDVTTALLDDTIITVNAVTTLAVGDVSVIGYRADAPDGLVFVTWVDLLPGTSINFWDSGYIGGGDGTGQGAGGGTWRATEDFATWRNSTGSTVVAGTVIVLSFPNLADRTADLGSVEGALSGLSNSGDQIFVGQGQFTPINPPSGNPSTFNGTLVFGLDFNGDNTTWDAADNAQSSGLPSVLDVPNGNLAVTHIDNGQYTGTRTFTSISDARTAALNAANWTFEDTGSTVFDSTDFTISSEVSITLDTENAGATTLVGGWGTSTSVPGFEGANYAFTQPGTNSTATFTPTIPLNGQYEVFVNYSAHPNRASNAGLQVLHNDGVFATTLDQRTGGSAFNSVGLFNFVAGTSNQVIISAAGSDGFVTADAVRFVRVGDMTTPPTAQLISPSNGGVLTATVLNDQRYIEIAFSPAATIDGNSITDAAAEFTLSGSGVNDVVVNGAAVSQGNGVFRYSFTGSFVPGEVIVNFEAGSFEDSAQQGVPNVATQQSFTLIDGVVRITLDNTDAMQVNTWSSSGAIPGYVGTDYLFNFAGAAGRLVYTFPIPTDGSYEVFVNYTDGPSRASNAAYEVVSQNGTSVRRVDQRTGGGTFQSIGTFNFLAGSTGSVTLRASDADGIVIGDAVRFVRVGDLTGAPTATLADPLAGTTIVVTTLNGRNYLDVTFTATSGAALDLPTITDPGQEFTLVGPGAMGVTVNGAATPVSGTTYRYATDGEFSPGAVDAVFAAGTFGDILGNQNIETIASFVVGEDVQEEIVVDNTSSGFSVNDPNGQFVPSSSVGGFIGDNYLAAPAGSTATATWTPTITTAGQYQVFVRYTSHPLRATNAKYTVSHNGGSTDVNIDQTVGGGTWVPLGTFNLSNGAFVMLDSTGANQFVIADAVRFVRI